MRLKPGNFLIPIFLLLSAFSAFGQKSKSQLERQKQENLKRIQETTRLLSQTKKQKEVTLSQLTLLSKEIEARREVITTISSEVNLLDEEIAELHSVINSMEADLIALKEEYAEMIYQASKTQSYYDKLTFIFSAEDFNQLMMRLKYFKQYTEARRYQVEQIEKVKAELGAQRVKIQVAKEEKSNLLTDQIKQQENLSVLKVEQDEVVKELNQKEEKLKKEVAEREKSNKKLDKLIEDIVKREIEKARREEERRRALEAKNKNKVSVTPEVSALSSSFAANAKKLPWPVVHGQISQKFGKHPHPVLGSTVITENLGVDILTLQDEPVRAVFDGKVIRIADVPGMNRIVMIQHGEYYTVYARLKSVSVTTGQAVTTKDVIGYVYTNKDGNAELQFQVWKKDQKMDPEQWLYKK